MADENFATHSIDDDSAARSSERASDLADSQSSRFARDLAQMFNDECKAPERQGQFHPVLIFGTSQSGKSLALAALLNFARKAGSQMDVSLLEFNYPLSCPNAPELRDWALEFFNGEISSFFTDPQFKVSPSRRSQPFFVPIQVFFRSGAALEIKEPCRFAFLESNGEFIHRATDGFTPQKLRPEIEQILKHFNHPLSVVFVAPAGADGVLNEAGVQNSHECLVHCMDEYVRLRSRKRGDNLLFLVSKWDARYPPARALEPDSIDNFANPKSEVVIDAISNLPPAWNRFAQLADVAPEVKAMTPYAATWIIRGARQDEGDTKPIFDRYHKTVWNWLYGNVFSDTTGKSRSKPQRKNFYKEFAPVGSSIAGLYKNSLKWFVSLT